MTQNRAAIQTAFGGPELIAIEQVPLADPGPGEVRVKVAAASLNPIDWKLGAYPALAEAFGAQVPIGYGSDFAGVVDAVGEGVDQVAVGDQVFGGVRGQGVVQFNLVPAASLEAVPEGLSLDDAATLSGAAKAAIGALQPLNLGPEDTVLIGGAAGGVGVFAVQLAAQTGATVIATGSQGNHDFLRELGAIPVTYGEGLVDRVSAATDRPLTAAVDLQGTEVVDAALQLGVAPQRITAIAAASLPDGVIATGSVGAPAGSLAQVAAKVASGELKVVISGRYPLDQTVEAVERLKDGHVRGKLIILPQE